MTSKFFATLRFLAAFGLLGSVVWQVTDRLAHNLFRPGEYFAYFSIQSTLIAAVMMAITGWALWRGVPETRTLTLMRLCAVTFEVIVALVYNALLRGLPPAAVDAGYAWPVLPNEVMHVWGPVLVLLDWVLASWAIRVRYRAVFWVLAFPLVWVLFTIVRGSISGWWPYWFLDPTGTGGVGSMIMYIFGIMVLLVIGASVVLGLQRLAGLFRK